MAYILYIKVELKPWFNCGIVAVVWMALSKTCHFELKACNEYIVQDLEWDQMAMDQFVLNRCTSEKQ